MFEWPMSRINAFYREHLPIGDRLGEMFYAIWMVVVSLGFLGSTELERDAVIFTILLAFSVNITWGLIDGISVMHTNTIEKAKAEKSVYELRTKNDGPSRQAVSEAMGNVVKSGLSEEERGKILDLIARAPPGDDPANKRYYPGRDGWYYALGILAIDAFLVVPLVAPLLIWSDPSQALYASRLIATVLFAILGAAYARNLHRRKWLAALFLGTLCFSVSTLAFLAGW
jgi:hypothetical protein